ncbi:MAG: hypothetical protein ABI954_05200 [Pyrinomonadaceae bacterium]
MKIILTSGKTFVLTPHRGLFVLFFWAILQINPILCLAQPDAQKKDARFFESAAVKAYQEKNYSSFLENMRAAASLRPNHPRLMYNLAAGYALTGQSGEALVWLNKLAKMGLVYPANKDSDFDSIKESSEFKTILQKFEHNKAPVSNSTIGFTVHEKDLIPESVAYDPATKTFYLSSIYKRKIVSINEKGEVKDFATENSGLWSVMGMKVDTRHGHLWVCTTAHPQMSNYKNEENGSSALFKYDLPTGKVLKKYFLTNQPKLHWLGDLIINSRGDVFATDSLAPEIYVVRHQKDELELFLTSEMFSSLQGLDFTQDEKHLFVADYAKGIFIIDQQTKKITNLSPPADSTLLGIDGLYFYQGSLLAVQNGVNPHRVIRFYLNRDQNNIERSETLEANNPVFDEPTLGVLFQNSFYFVANSQWGAIDQKGNLAPAEKLKDPQILKINLRH